MRNTWLSLFLLALSVGVPAGVRAQPASGAPADATVTTPPPVALPPPADNLSTTYPAAVSVPPLPPRNRLVLNNLLVIRFNPVGLEDQMRFGYQRRLRDRQSLLLRDNFLFVGIAPRLNPAFIKIGPSVEIQPVSIFNLRVGVEYLRFFSTFGFLQSFGSPLDEYDDRRIAICSSKDPAVLQKCSYRDPEGATVTAPRRAAQLRRLGRAPHDRADAAGPGRSARAAQQAGHRVLEYADAARRPGVL
jgi:hypothetical protein